MLSNNSRGLTPELWRVSPVTTEEPLGCVHHRGDCPHKVSGREQLTGRKEDST